MDDRPRRMSRQAEKEPRDGSAAPDRFLRLQSARWPVARPRPRPDAENFGGEVSLASSSLIVVCRRVNGRGRATRAWIDRTNDGLSGCPPTASACRQKGTSARPAGAARRLGYINGATGRKGHDRLWHFSAVHRCPLHGRFWGTIRTLSKHRFTAEFAPERSSVGRKADRKSTRLNFSHLGISYAVFC